MILPPVRNVVNFEVGAFHGMNTPYIYGERNQATVKFKSAVRRRAFRSSAIPQICARVRTSSSPEGCHNQTDPVPPLTRNPVRKAGSGRGRQAQVASHDAQEASRDDNPSRLSATTTDLTCTKRKSLRDLAASRNWN